MRRHSPGHPSNGSLRASFVVSVVILVATGCGSSKYSVTTSVPTNSEPSGTSLSSASTDPVLVPATGCCEAGPSILLTGITTEHQTGFDRVVFQFSAPVVNYHVRYVPLPVKQDPSDVPVVLQGDNALQLSVGATSLDQSVNPPSATYSGAQRLVVGKGSITEAVQTGDFEAVLNWAIGVRGKPAFRVTAESNPARLVIDVASS